MKKEVVYSITEDGKTVYYSEYQNISISIEVPYWRIQEVLTAGRKYGLARIKAKFEGDRYHGYLHKSGGAYITVLGCACHIFDLLNELNIHAHYGHNYHDKPSNFSPRPRKVERDYKAYKLSKITGELIAKNISCHCVKQWRENGWHVVKAY